MSAVKWQLVLKLRIRDNRAAVVIGNESNFVQNELVDLKIPLALGSNSLWFTVINEKGAVSEYSLRVQLEPKKSDIAVAVDRSEILRMGPLFYSRTITKTGAAVGGDSQARALAPGLRAVYRKELFKSLTKRLPLDLKLHFEGSGTLARTVSGDASALGTPVWSDLLMTLGVLGNRGLLIEGALGATLFLPSLTSSEPGDVENFLGLAISGRFGYYFSPKFSAQIGGLVALPSSDHSGGNVIETFPFDSWLSAEYAGGKDNSFEVRLRYFKVATHGSIVLSGNFTRSESFLGGEVLWVRRF